jgi:peptidylprolyl isomerase
MLSASGCYTSTVFERVSDAGGDAGGDRVAPTLPADSAASDSEAGPDLYLPTGYALTPFLSATPIRRFAKADTVLDPLKAYVAVLDTDAGRLVLSLYSAETPVTCNSFVFLARNHFFDGIAFHRVIDDFVAQGGDPNSVSGAPSSWGRGGPGYTFGLEVNPALNFDGPGVVGMARAASPDSNGSQFFITLKDTPSLNQMYTVFAKVMEGEAVLSKIVRGEPPAMPTRIKLAYVGEKTR